MEEESITDKATQGQIDQLTALKDPNIASMFMTLCQQPDPNIQHLISSLNPNPNDGNKEKERITNRLSGFNPKDNVAWREITSRFGNNIKQQELLSIANVLANSASLKLDRDAKRRKCVLIKWFEENWQAIFPFLDYVVLEEAQHS